MNLYTFISNWLALLSPHATDAIWLKEQEAVSKLRLVPIPKLTIDDLFHDDDYERERMSHEDYSLLGRRRGVFCSKRNVYSK